jgi:hypothetical protein
LQIHATQAGEAWWVRGVLLGGVVGAVDGILAAYVKDIARRHHGAGRCVAAAATALGAATIAGLVTFSTPDLPLYAFLPKFGSLPRLCTASAAFAAMVACIAVWAVFPSKHDVTVWH